MLPEGEELDSLNFFIMCIFYIFYDRFVLCVKWKVNSSIHLLAIAQYSIRQPLVLI